MDDTISRIERWGLLSGVTGCVANALLAGLWVSIGTGDQDFRWTGPANDVIGGVVSSAAGIPFVLAMSALADDTAVRRVVPVAVTGQAAIVVSSVLLVTDVLPFEVQVFIAVPGIAALLAWVWTVGRSRRLPFSRAARLIGAGGGAGLALAAASLTLPGGSLAQYAVGGLGIAAGASAFLAYPVWQLRLAAGLRDALADPRRQPLQREGTR